MFWRVIVGIAATLTFACGEIPSAVEDSGPPDTSSATDASNPFAVPDTGPSTPFVYDAGTTNCAPCPDLPPVKGSSCSTPMLQCEYGTHPFVGCNPLYGCVPADGGAIWVPGKIGPRICEAPTTGGPCPASPIDLHGTLCPWVTQPVVCGYSTGFCSCGPPTDGTPDRWSCDLDPSCPIRPRLGCACPTTCNRSYGMCTLTCGAHATFQCAE